jgi:hypothetical protein
MNIEVANPSLAAKAGSPFDHIGGQVPRTLLAAGLAALALLSIPARAGAQCLPPPSNLVSWWAAEGDATDVTGTNNGTLEGGVTFTNGEVGQTFSFDGSSGYVLVPDSPSLRITNQLTIEAWINTRSTNTDRCVVAKVGGTGGNNGYQFVLSKNALVGLFNSPGQSWPSATISRAIPIVLGSWNHVAFTYDQSSLKLYFNGVPVATNVIGAVAINTSTSNLRVGDDDSHDTPFDGQIDEASLYNRALSAAEIAAIYNSGPAGKCGPLPAITHQPQNQTITLGMPAAFTVSATGLAPFSYQWQFNTNPILGATNSSLTFASAQLTNAGAYSVVVGDRSGVVASSNAVLTVNTPVCAPPSANLVSWWQAEGDATDINGNNPGILEGGATFASGEVGQAFSFNGSGQYVKIPKAPDLDVGNQLTVEFWMRADPANPLNSIQGFVTSDFYAAEISSGGGSHMGVDFAISTDGGATYAEIASANGGGAVVSAGVWHHVAGTYDGTNVVLYIDGQPYGNPVAHSGAISSMLANSFVAIGSEDGRSGCPSCQGTRYFNGRIDEASIYNRALSAAEILAIYNASSAGKCLAAPAITSQPQSQTVSAGLPAGFTVSVTAVGPLSYQWLFNSSAITGATNSALNFASVQFTNAGSYSVVVSNRFGPVTSSNAVLTVTAPVCAPPQGTLVSWWQAEGDATDITGRNPGVLQGGATFAAGEVGQAFSFNGSGQYVKIPKAPDLDVGNQVTVEFWMKADPSNPMNTFQGLVASDFWCAEISIGSGSTWGVSFGISTDSGSTFPDTTDAPGNGGGAAVSAGVWHHIAGTYDGNNVLLYVDGQQWRNPYPHSGALSPMLANSFVTIGSEDGRSVCPSCQGARYFKGLIDEASVYNRALSAAEILAIYNASSAGKCIGSPAITSQPQGQTVIAGLFAGFSVSATGVGPVTYQWLFDTHPIQGATNSALSFVTAQLTNAGTYAVVVGNPHGSITSSNAVLTVNASVCDSPPSNLVGWWQGEGDAADVTGTNGGSLQGGATFASGEVGQAFVFDGSTGCVVVSNSPSLQITNQLTIEAWINTRSTSVDGSIVSKVGGSGGNNGYQMTLTGNALKALFNSPGAPWPSAVLSSSVPIAPGTWNHVAFTFDQSAMKLYFNGQPIATNIVGPAAINTSSSNLRIGDDDSNNTPFNGWIDEASIYNRALSAAEIAAIYNAASAGKCGPPPTIVTQPQNQTANVGYSAGFGATIAGARPLSYQWLFNNVPIPGATNAVLSIASAQFTNAGSYKLSVSSLHGQTTTSNAVLTVTSPTTRYVNAANAAPSAPYASWPTAAKNIQDAVSLSMSGDQVLVTNGIYQFGGQVVFGAMTNRVAVTQPYVTVQSVNGPGVTTILGHQVPETTTGNTAVRCVYLANNAVLAGFTLNAGATRNSGDVVQEESGGGVWCASSNAVVSNCVLFGNAAFSNGGGVYQGTITNCFLSGDSAGAAGGGAYQATLNNCILDACSANNGGGAANSTLNACTLDSNAASTDGGGAYACRVNDCMLTGNSATFGGGAYLGSLTNCELNGNSSSGQGGGADQAMLNNCTVMNNSSPAGGGAYNCTATSCLVAGNSAGSQGGGVDLGLLYNCTLTGNTSSNAGGGAFSATLLNSISYYNMAPTGTNFDTASGLTNCCSLPLPSLGTGNITNAPLFANQGAGDFHLQPTSPCINAGNNSYVTTAMDLDGNPRVVGGTVDIGAYEFQSDTGSFAAWLALYGFPTNGTADYLDSDGTGMNNWQKWRAGLNPTNAASVLKMVGAVKANPGVAVTWQSVGGITYYLQRAGSLQTQPAFSSIQSNIFGQPVTTTIVDPTATGPGPFYFRVGVQ